MTYDFVSRTAAPAPDHLVMVWFVRGVEVQRLPRDGGWLRRDDRTAKAVPVPELAGTLGFGLLDDDRLLCRAGHPTGPALLAWHVASGAVDSIPLPVHAHAASKLSAIAPLHECGSTLPRDGSGHVWLRFDEPGRIVLLRLHMTTLHVDVVPLDPVADGSFALLAWLDGGAAFLAKERNTVQRVDVATGARTQLFPATNQVQR